MARSEQKFSVGELTQYIKLLLEEDGMLQGVWVQGEVSNLTRHSSGHVYFTLKDENAQLAIVMFRGVASQYKWLPANGDKISVQGSISVYPARGNYQLIATRMEKLGQGDLHRLFLELKEKLEAEGLFDPARKRALPRFPKVIGIATSPTGAVIRDIITTVSRRFPHVKLLLCPTVVQGEQAKASILSSLKRLNAREDVELIILARGGGSLEDLWCFNEEDVARAISASPKPVISAIGHETDFTIADFVADRRAPTPTAAAEMAVPEIREINELLRDSGERMKRGLRSFIDFRRQVLDDHANRLTRGILHNITQARGQLEALKTKLDAYHMGRVLERGYSITMKDGKTVLNAVQLQPGDTVETIFARGRSRSTIQNLIEDEKER